MLNISTGLAPPSPVFGVRSVKCECDWEVVFIIPEEIDLMISALFDHLKIHGNIIPTFVMTEY